MVSAWFGSVISVFQRIWDVLELLDGLGSLLELLVLVRCPGVIRFLVL